ncbi:anti-phage dCTP deaminase [Duganella margarita]|nr:anti-phage dCTP deaminase [Duganella margarita]
MATSALKSIKAGTAALASNASTTDMISSTHTEELVIALCGPIGSPLHSVGDAIRTMLLDSFGYTDCTYLRLSDFIVEHASAIDTAIPLQHNFARINALIEAGNKLREKYGNGVLAELAIHRIRLDREQHKTVSQSARYAPRRVVHIIDSIKNEEELELLRLVYRDMLYVVGVFAPLQTREANLKDLGLTTAQIYSLVDRDSGEESEAGQTVSETFPNCDFFLRTGDGTDSELKRRVERFLHLVLGTKVITPTFAETAMYSAAMASANSACLSRQVGAAVTDRDGDILSIGWNDVPATGGGLYGRGEHDHRCWNISGGKCFNDAEKDKLAQEMVEALAEVIEPQNLPRAKEILRGASKLKGLIEFSRAIHAEMHAILNAGKTSGMRIDGGKLFVTTYPCHSCARHIVAAGISEVYYIEPYRKSLAIKLHGDAISEHEIDKDKVRILAYDGVAPSQYLSLFRVPQNSRKKNGKLITMSLKESSPRLEKSMEALPALEGLVVKSLLEKHLLPERGPQNDGSPPAPGTAQF